jgi:SAM-dependent methyltransferase
MPTAMWPTIMNLNPFSLRSSFEAHSAHFAARVRDRGTEGHLSRVDELLMQFLMKNWSKTDPGVLIDAGCGTGDRLKALFTHNYLPQTWFNRIIGIDYAASMLKYARNQYIGDHPLYNDLRHADLLEISDVIPGDVVICLWGIVNGVCLDAFKLLKKLTTMTRKKGFLIFDVATTELLGFFKEQEEVLLKSLPDLPMHSDKQTVWYQRYDKTIGYLRFFSPVEINSLIYNAGAKLLEVWGYSWKDVAVGKINLLNSRIHEDEIAKYGNVLIFMRRG